jgi:hypothetical protein
MEWLFAGKFNDLWAESIATQCRPEDILKVNPLCWEKLSFVSKVRSDGQPAPLCGLSLRDAGS